MLLKLRGTTVARLIRHLGLSNNGFLQHFWMGESDGTHRQQQRRRLVSMQSATRSTSFCAAPSLANCLCSDDYRFKMWNMMMCDLFWLLDPRCLSSDIQDIVLTSRFPRAGGRKSGMCDEVRVTSHHDRHHNISYHTTSRMNESRCDAMDRMDPAAPPWTSLVLCVVRAKKVDIDLILDSTRFLEFSFSHFFSLSLHTLPSTMASNEKSFCYTCGHREALKQQQPTPLSVWSMSNGGYIIYCL